MADRIVSGIAAMWQRAPGIAVVTLFGSTCGLVVGGMFAGYLLGQCVTLAWTFLFGGELDVQIVKCTASIGAAGGCPAAFALIMKVSFAVADQKKGLHD